MSKDVTVALVGVGGYGRHYVGRLLDGADELGARCVAAIDTQPERCDRLDELTGRGARVYTSLDAFHAEGSADLAILSLPIQLHAPFTCACLARGSHVLCEKPLAGTVQEGRRMLAAERETGRFVAIGYQWSYNSAIQALKADIMSGALGKPVRLKTLLSWPRPHSYYRRNDWAGRRKTPGGDWILDSPAHNATAHYLHNMFYVLGPTRETSAMPVDVQAELYRANAIDNFDTCALRAHTENGAEILFYTSHAVPSRFGPLFRYEFEKGQVTYDSDAGTMLARFADGISKEYGNPNAESGNKTADAVQAVRTGRPAACGVGAALAQVLCVNGAQDSMPEIAAFPESMVRVEPGQGAQAEDGLTWAEGLQASFVQCYDQAVLPSEQGCLSWARAGRPIDLRGYGDFPGGSPALTAGPR